MPPMTGWIKNINDNAIHGGKRTPPPRPSSPTATPPSGDTRANGNASAANLSVTPLLASLALGLRGDLAYSRCPRGGLGVATGAGGGGGGGGDDAFGDLAAAAALAPLPGRDPAVRSRLREGLRQELLGDRKLRVARFLLEAAVAGGRAPPPPPPPPLQDGAGGGDVVAGTELQRVRGQLQQQQKMDLSGRKTGRLLALLAGVLGRRRLDDDGGRDCDADDGDGVAGRHPGAAGPPSPSPVSRQRPPPGRPPLSVKKDVLMLIRPVYALLGEALLGEKGLARRLTREILAVAAALAVAGLDHTLPATAGTTTTEAAAAAAVQQQHGQGEAAGATARGRGVVDVVRAGVESPAAAAAAAIERRAVECFAEAVVLAVSTSLGAVVASVAGGDEDDCGGDGLADLGPRESDLERLLVSLGAWESRAGGGGRGWPHSAPPPATSQEGSGGGGGGDGGQDAVVEEIDIPLPELLDDADKLAAALRSAVARGGAGGTSGAIVRRLDGALAPRIKACRDFCL